MYAEERQAAIANRARSQGRVEVTDLAEAFDVSTETVRRDLAALERNGLLRRVHGGAITVDLLGFEPALNIREAAQVEEKSRIAEAALDFVPSSGAIAIDAGSSTQRLAEILPPGRELTVVTNSLPIASTLAGRKELTVHLTGGRVRGRTLATVDRDGAGVPPQHLRRCGLPRHQRVLAGPRPEHSGRRQSAVKAAFVAASRRRILLADHQFGQDHFALRRTGRTRRHRHRLRPVTERRRRTRRGRTESGSRMIITVTLNPSLDRARRRDLDSWRGHPRRRDA